MCSYSVGVTVFVRTNAFDFEQFPAGSNTELSALIARDAAAIPRFRGEAL